MYCYSAAMECRTVQTMQPQRASAPTIPTALLLSHRHSERPKGAQQPALGLSKGLKGVEESPVGVTLAIASRDSSTRYAPSE
jgi:hypothetical protein